MLEGKKCYIGCSGNFTIEQILSKRCKDTKIYSNDVSLYSSAIGFVLKGRKLEMKVVNPEIAWTQQYIDHGAAKSIAVLLLLLDLFKYEKRNNAFQERMWDTYLSQWEKMLQKTTQKVQRAIESIDIRDYTMVDVYDYYPQKDGVSIGFLPTYVGGYEKLFSRLEESIQWDIPSYQLLTRQRREETIKRMSQGEYILYDDQESDLPCVARVDLFGKRSVYIYSNILFRKGLIRRKINEKITKYKLLMPEDRIPEDSEIRIIRTDNNTINHYRNLFLSKKIQPTAGDISLLVFINDKLFGFLIFNSYSRMKSAGDNSIYMLSDFVVPSKHKRLSKLLLMASKCKDLKTVLQEKLIRKVDAIITTAFTNKPVSMKYRGIYQLIKRGDGFLNYQAEFEDTSLKEVIKAWMKKYNKP